MKKVREGVFSFDDRTWGQISQKAKDFIRRLLTYDMNARPSAEDALHDPWIEEQAVLQVDEGLAINALDNLKDFKADVTLKQATFAFIAS